MKGEGRSVQCWVLLLRERQTEWDTGEWIEWQKTENGQSSGFSRWVPQTCPRFQGLVLLLLFNSLSDLMGPSILFLLKLNAGVGFCCLQAENTHWQLFRGTDTEVHWLRSAFIMFLSYRWQILNWNQSLRKFPHVEKCSIVISCSTDQRQAEISWQIFQNLGYIFLLKNSFWKLRFLRA